MFTSPDVLRAAQEMARHAATKQAVTAENTANADTPGYRARDVAEFSEFFEQSGRINPLKRTHALHLSAAAPAMSPRIVDAGGAADPNGNTVSLETELIRASDAKSQHDTALTVYRASLDVLRTSLGRGR